MRKGWGQAVLLCSGAAAASSRGNLHCNIIREDTQGEVEEKVEDEEEDEQEQEEEEEEEEEEVSASSIGVVVAQREDDEIRHQH